MYKNYNGIITITVNDWVKAGLTYDQFRMDSQRGFLKIFRRATHGNTLINVNSIIRPDRIAAIERTFGKLEEKAAKSIFEVKIDQKAQAFYMNYRKPDGSPLEPEKITEYVNRASILNALRRGLEKQIAARAKAGKKVKKTAFWQLAADWYLEQIEKYPSPPLSNPRALRRVYERYIKEGYGSLIHGNLGNDAARKVSVSIESLLLALWRTNDKPFINVVHQRYLEFISGNKILYDRKTGEEFHPEDFRHKGRAMEISVATVWAYLKDVVNETAIYADRNGNFDYVNTHRPKQHRKLGRYSLSKISMDDVALSRKSVRGWVFKYIAVDVVSGYYFRPAYVVGKPTHKTVIESFRNMFVELYELGLPMPGELEVEHHLMKDLDWLGELFPFVRFAKSSTDKRAEHNIRALKYGAAKRAGHTRGRWYAKHEAYRAVRNKVSGDMVEPTFQPQTIVADDLADIETHNNELHPLQKTYPGMTRKEVLLSQVNPELEAIEPWHLYRYIGNVTETSIYKNDYCPVNSEEFELVNFNDIKKLKSNNRSVTAYWLPEADGSINKVYLYQGSTYIGEAINRAQFDYNENAIERDENDIQNMLHQNKRLSTYDKFIKEQRADIPKIYSQRAEQKKNNVEAPVEIMETVQPKGYDSDDLDEDVTDWAEKAMNSL